MKFYLKPLWGVKLGGMEDEKKQTKISKTVSLSSKSEEEAKVVFIGLCPRLFKCSSQRNQTLLL
jgi:hypothetical protein